MFDSDDSEQFCEFCYQPMSVNASGDYFCSDCRLELSDEFIEFDSDSEFYD